MSFTATASNRALLASVVLTVFLVSGILTVLADPGSGADGQVNSEDDLPLVNRIEDVSIHSTSIAMNRKVMDWHGNDLFLAYIHENEQGASSAKLIVSSDRGRTWSDPVTVWPPVQCYAMKVDILIDGGTLFYFINIREEEDWETWSIQAYDVPVHDWYNISYFNPTRIDSLYSGYSSHTQALKFEDKVIYFRTRSHYVDLPYRIYDNGEWGATELIDSGTYISNFAAVSSDISGTETIYFVYQYYNQNRAYLTTSTDGLNWTGARELKYFSDAPQRLSLVEYNNGLHLIINERNGYDVYHAYSYDGITWSDFVKIGENTEKVGSSIRPVPDDVSLVSNGTTMIAAFDHDDGIEVMVYDENSGDFVQGAFLKNDTSRYPTFDTRGLYLLYHENQNDLVVRSIGPFELDTDNEPVDPDDDDDQNDPDPPVNDTDPDDDDDTGDPDPPGEWDDLVPPGEPEMVAISDPEADENTVRLEAFIPNPGDYSEDEINYTWSIDGMGEVGHGSSILLELPPGDHRITLRAEYSEGRFVESSRWLRMGDEPVLLDDKGKGWELQPLIIVAIAIVFLTVVVLILVGFIFKRKQERETSQGRRPGERREVDTPEGPTRTMISDQGDLVTSGRIGDLDPVPTTGRYADYEVGTGARSDPKFGNSTHKDSVNRIDISGLREKAQSMGPRRSRTSIREEILERTLIARDRGEMSEEAFRAVDDILNSHH